MSRLLDLRHPGPAIGAYLLETPEGPALFDCGPGLTYPHLREELAAAGLRVGDLRHLLLSHIHLDHAGAAGMLVRDNPGLEVWVGESGAPHLVHPERLERSARRFFGEAFDTLWGSELLPVPAGNVRVVGERVLGLECFPTPGHAGNHVTYLDAEGTMYNGDAAGARLAGTTTVNAPTPPPEIDVELWSRSLDEMLRRRPARLALVHLGVYDDVERHLEELRERLHRWSARVGEGVEQQPFDAEVRAEFEAAEDPETAERLIRITSGAQSWLGLSRYWAKRGEADAAA